MLFGAADPNWFYSTLAQSTAALVGLAGAFLVQRLLTQRSEVGPLREAIREELGTIFKKYVAMEVLEVEAALDTLEEALTEARASTENRGIFRVSRTVNALDAKGGASGEVALPPPKGFDGIALLEAAVADVHAYLDALRAVSWDSLAEQVRLQGRLAPADPAWLDDPGPRPATQRTIPGNGLWPRLEEQRFIAAMRWGQFQGECEAAGHKLADLRSRLVPRSLYILFGILGALLLSGVVAPLFFLSAEGGVSKWILLGLFIPFATGFVAFYGFELRRLRRSDRIVEEPF